MTLTAFTNVFAGNPLDRASDKRGDATWIAEQLGSPECLAVAMWNGKPLVESAKDGGVQLSYLPAKMARELSGGPERLLFMGLWQGTAVFAVDIDTSADPADGPLEGLGRFEDLRAIATALPAGDAGISATARAMFEWHRHCSNCGEPSVVAEAGWKRICPACEAQHFPRTDPVVIMLAVCGERCLLGRGAHFPPRMYSALAGFLEPGESIEEACARELFEEAGLRATRVRYHSTQPWPYPSSLMIGLIAEVAEGEAVPDNVEIHEVRWFSREETRSLLAGGVPDALAPGGLAIAHQLIRAWANEG
jgi:NAD+ diphosphatase